MVQPDARYMQMAIDTAVENVAAGRGGPFGAVVVRRDEVIASAGNEVTSAHDPTAHAEMLAIRRACTALGTFRLTDCVVYSSCEPCPMCLGALFWARPAAVFYAATRRDAAAAGFDDAQFWAEIRRTGDKRRFPLTRVPVAGSDAPFRSWLESPTRIDY